MTTQIPDSQPAPRRVRSIILLWLPPLLVGLGLALSCWAWLRTGARLDDAAYKAIGALYQLAPYQDLATRPASWQLHAGRWLTAVGVFWTAVAAVLRLFADDITRLRGRAGRWQAVVIGEGALAREAWRAAARQNEPVIWLGARRLVAGWRRLGLPRQEGKIELDHVTSHADHARHVLVAGLPLPETVLMARAARKASKNAAITLIATDDTAARQAANLLDDPACHPVSEAALIASALHRVHPPFLSEHARAAGRVRLVLVGFGATSQAIARDLIINGRTTWLELPEIIVIDPAASAKLAAWRASAPELDLIAQITAVDGRLCPESPMPLDHGLLEGGIARVCVCLGDDAATLATLAVLSPVLSRAGVAPYQVFARLRTADLAVGGAASAGFASFGGTAEVLAESGFLSADGDRAARAYHDAWLKAQATNPQADRANPAAQPWQTLPDTYRAASRAAAAHIPAKLASAGIDPALWLGKPGLPQLPAGTQLYADQAGLMALAALEHERWNAERRLDGWAHADLPRKDEARKLHPSLVPFEALSPAVQAYDVALVKETAGFLGGGRGYSLSS